MGFPEFIVTLKEFGIVEFYLPFVLMFAIFYGLLNKSKIFGEAKEAGKINAVISLIASLFVMVYSVSVAEFLGFFFVKVMLILVTTLCFLMVVYMIVPEGKIGELLKDPKKYAKYVVPFAIITALVLFLSAGGLEMVGIGIKGGPSGFGISAGDAVVVILIVVTILIIWFITRDGKMGKKIVGYKPTPVYED